MAYSYKRLWKLLIDRDLKKKDLADMAGLSTYTIQKMNRNENVNTETLTKICRALKCTFDDIVEITDTGGNTPKKSPPKKTNDTERIRRFGCKERLETFVKAIGYPVRAMDVVAYDAFAECKQEYVEDLLLELADEGKIQKTYRLRYNFYEPNKRK